MKLPRTNVQPATQDEDEERYQIDKLTMDTVNISYVDRPQMKLTKNLTRKMVNMRTKVVNVSRK